MKQNQLDTLKLNICIKTVWLAVRFNCKLSFVLKNDLSEVLAHTENSYPLTRGEAIVNDYISCPLPHQLTNAARKIKIFVYLVSANGIVPAGFAVLPTQTKQKTSGLTYMLPLQRCEDPKAQIKLILSVDSSTKVSAVGNSEVSRNAESKRFNSPISNLDSFREISRPSYSAAKVQHSKLRQKIPYYQNINSREFKVASPEKKVEKEPDSELSREQLIKEHQQYWVQIVRMEGENESLKEEIASLKSENQTLKNNFQAIKLQNQELKLQDQKIYALVRQVNEANQNISKLESQLHATKQQHQASSNESYSLGQQLKRTQMELKDALEEVAKLSSRVQTQYSQAESNRQTIQNLKWEKSHIIEQTEDLNKQLMHEKSQKLILRDENQKLKTQICQLELQIQRLKQSASKLLNQHQEDRVLNQNLIKEAQNDKKRVEKMQQEHKQQIFHLENNHETLVKKLKLAEHTNEALKSQLAALKQKNAELQREFELMAQVLKTQQEQKQIINEKQQEQINRIKQQNIHLKNRINQAEAELQSYSLEIAQLKQKQASAEYYDSYNKSITEITLNQIKVEKEKNELARKYEEAKLYAQEKEKELLKTKEFAKNNLQEILKLRRQKQELQNKLNQLNK